MEIYTQVPDKATRDALRRLSAELDEQPPATEAAADDDGQDDAADERRRGWLGPCCCTLLVYSPESGAELGS